MPAGEGDGDSAFSSLLALDAAKVVLGQRRR